MTKSAFTIPHVTTFDECDMSKLVAWRKKYVDQIEKEHGVRITYMPFFVKAIIFAAKDYPWINATFEGDNLHVKKYFNIGMAVARQNSLIVPVVKHCEQKSLLQIAKELQGPGRQGQQRQAFHRRNHRRDFHHHQRRPLRRQGLDPHHRAPAGGDPRRTHDRGQAGRARWPDRDPPDAQFRHSPSITGLSMAVMPCSSCAR